MSDIAAPAPVAAPENRFSDDEIKQFESVYRRVGVIPHEDGAYEIVIKPAEKLQWRVFRADANDEDKRSDAQEKLIKQTVVAVAYNGEKATDVDGARKLLERLTADWTSATDGKEISRLIFRVNGQAGSRGK